MHRASSWKLSGNYFERVPPRHVILPNLELSALLVEWFTMWTGLMILASLEEGTELSLHFNFVEFFTVVVAAVNVLLMLWFVFNLVRECKHEHSDAAHVLATKLCSFGHQLKRLSFRFDETKTRALERFKQLN